MKKKNVKVVEFIIMLVVAAASSSIACFVWFNQTAGIVLAAVAAAALVAAVVVALVKTSRNRDEQTRKSTYKVDWKFAAVAAIAAAALVFIVAIPFAPIKTGWVLIPSIPLIAILFAVASSKGKKAVGLALAMLLMMVGTTGLTYAAMHDFEFGGETTVIEGDVINATELNVSELDATQVNVSGEAEIDKIEAENVKFEAPVNVNDFKANKAEINTMNATEVNITNATVENLNATNVAITEAHIDTMNATEVNITNATVENLNATNVNIENATIAPTEPTTSKPTPAPTEPTTSKPTPAPTEPTTSKPTPAPTEPTTQAPVKNPSLKISSSELYKGGRVIVTLKDCSPSEVSLGWSDAGSWTSRGLSLRHIGGNQYDLVVADELFNHCPTIQLHVGSSYEYVDVLHVYD